MPNATINCTMFSNDDPYVREDYSSTAAAAAAWTKEHAAAPRSTQQPRAEEMMDMNDSTTATVFPSTTSPARDPYVREYESDWNEDAPATASTPRREEHTAGERVATVIDGMKERFDDFVGGIKDGLDGDDDVTTGKDDRGLSANRMGDGGMGPTTGDAAPDYRAEAAEAASRGVSVAGKTADIDTGNSAAAAAGTRAARANAYIDTYATDDTPYDDGGTSAADDLNDKLTFNELSDGHDVTPDDHGASAVPRAVQAAYNASKANVGHADNEYSRTTGAVDEDCGAISNEACGMRHPKGTTRPGGAHTDNVSDEMKAEAAQRVNELNRNIRQSFEGEVAI